MGLGRWPGLCGKPVLCEASKGSRGEGIEGYQQDPVTPAPKVATTSTTVPSAGPVAGSRSFLSRLREGDEIARIITFLFAASVVLVTLLLVFELWQGSVLPRHKFGFNFFRTSVWDPIFDQFVALPFISGTLFPSLLSLPIPFPLAICPPSLLAPRAGKQLGRWSFPLPVAASWARVSWPSRAPPAKPWPSPWSSEIPPRSALLSFLPAIPLPPSSPTNSPKLPAIFICNP